MSGERLQKVIARAGLGSRRTAEDWIRQGRVTVNGQIATLGDRADPATDAILVDGKRLKAAAQPRYLLLNKPRGYVTSRSDPEGRRTVMDLIPAKLHRGLVPAGRLDYDSEGLVLMTTDGDLVLKVTHPRYGCMKTYEVKVKGQPSESTMRRFREGIVIDGKRTAPAKARLLHRPRPGKGEKNSWWTVEIGEGRKRQLREMFFRLGHPVQRLKRVAIGGLRDPALPLGAYRWLDEEEIRHLRDRRRRHPHSWSPQGRRPKGRRDR